MENRNFYHHISKVRRRYKCGTKKTKTGIINAICEDYQKSRKHVIRCLNGSTPGQGEHGHIQGRPCEYRGPVVKLLVELWKQMSYMNSKRMKQALPIWLPHYPKPVDENLRTKILKMSASTMDRLLGPYKLTRRRGLQSRTRPPAARALEKFIPIKPFQLKIDKPGFMEADTVAHCGGSLTGTFAWTLNMTDVDSGWTSQRAFLGKEAKNVLDSVKLTQLKLPFRMWAFHSDNGSEFINHTLMKYFDNPEDSVIFTRGRVYKKNDQAHVEQKNWTHVRDVFGYYRYDNEELVEAMNDIYENEQYLLQNFFFPQMKLKEKCRVGSKYRKLYDKPQSPYERLMKSPHIMSSIKEELKHQFESLNPFELKTTLEAKLKKLSNLLKKTGQFIEDKKAA